MSERVFPAILEAPFLALDFLRLSREVNIQESVYGMLVGMLEQAKILEVKDLPTIQVLDVAIPPKYPSAPRTLLNVLVAGALSLIFGILFAVFMDYLERLKSLKATSLPLSEGAGELSAIDSSDNGNKTEPYPSIPKHTEHLTG